MASQPSFAISGVRPGGWRAAAMGALLVAAGAIAYLPALRGGFLWDDDSVLSQNGLIQAADGLRRIWATTSPTDYWPVTNSLFWFEWRLWGAHPLGYHLVSLGLHLAGAGLLWAVLCRLRLPGAGLAAFLFAAHPVNVESVAWIAEQKNLVALLFFLASIGCFLRTEPVPEASRPRLASGVERLWYGLSLLAFVLALLSKGSVAMLPFVLVGVVAWRRRPTWGDGLRLAPFFVVGAVFVGIDIWFQKHGSSEVIRQASGLERLLGAGGVVWFYLSKALWPVDLTFVYPTWRIDPETVFWWLPLLAVIGVTGALLGLARLRAAGRGAADGPASDRRDPRFELFRSALYAWGYFCVTLVPVMGFTDVFFMRYSLVADRYQHLAMIGVIGFVAAGWGRWRGRASDPGRRVAGAAPAFGRSSTGSARWAAFAPQLAAAAVVGLLLTMTWRQSRDYRDPETLFRATIERNPQAWMAYDNLGVAAFNSGRVGEAITRYEQALRIRSDLYETQNYLGNALQAAGRVPEAIVHYREALRLKPDYADAHNNLGAALARSGQPDEAVRQIDQALRLRPDFPEAENNLGTVLAGSGQWREARSHFARALRLRPGYAEAEKNLAAATRALEGGHP